MNTKPLVSVIVPNYNYAKFLNKRLDSIFNQSYSNIEVILLDDCSTDNSAEILKSFEDHHRVSHYLRNTVNSGSPFLQWNKGISMATGDYIWIAESDDFCDIHFLEKLVLILNKDEEISIAYSQSYRVNEENEINGTWLFYTNGFDQEPFKTGFIMEGSDFIEKYLIHKNVIPNVSAVAFRKKNLQEIFPLKIDGALKYNADWFYYIQLLGKSKVGFTSEPLNYFRYHSKSVISTAGKHNNNLSILWRELAGRKLMLKILKDYQIKNFNKIKKEWEKGNKSRYATIFFQSHKDKDWGTFFKIIFLKPFFTLSLLLRKKIS